MNITSSPENGYVRGVTTIDHRRRDKLQLSLSEYVFLDTVEQLIDKHGKFLSKNMMVEFYKICGIDENAYRSLGAKMVKKGYLLPIGGKAFVPYPAWGKKSESIEKEFEEFWEKLGKKGNKKQGMVMYKRARKAGHTYEHLSERVKVYLKFLKESGQFSKHVSSFFNPVNEEFNNEFKAENKDKDEGEAGVYQGKF